MYGYHLIFCIAIASAMSLRATSSVMLPTTMRRQDEYPCYMTSKGLGAHCNHPQCRYGSTGGYCELTSAGRCKMVNMRGRIANGACSDCACRKLTARKISRACRATLRTFAISRIWQPSTICYDPCDGCSKFS